MKNPPLIVIFFIMLLGASACGIFSSDHDGPIISDISTSNKVLVISDCQSTSIIITTKVTDSSGTENVLLWYRVGSNQEYKSNAMVLNNDLYSLVLKGADLQGNGYGNLEFYISAKDLNGNSSKSAVDDQVQFLPCVNN